MDAGRYPPLTMCPTSAPLVSTVIPCFNGAPYVERAIASVLWQAGAEHEIIVVDDGSTDDSAARVAALAQLDSRIHLVRLPHNRGAGPARNAGIARASGRYLALLDVDDWWVPGKLARQLAELASSDAGLVYTGVEVRNVQGHVLGYRRVPPRAAAEGLLVHDVIATSSVLLDRVRTGSVWMPPLRLRQDLATWHALLARGVVARGIDEPLLVYTKRPDSLSANKLVAAQANWRLYRNYLQRPLPAAAGLFVRYATLAVLRV